MDPIDAVRFGRSVPKFSHEFSTYRIDKAPLIGYSAVVGDTSSARANGVEVGSHIGALQMIGGAFTGSRVGGDIPEHPIGVDLYLRLRRPFGPGLTAGTSHRWADKDALGVDVIAKRGDLQLTGEYVRTETTSEWYVLGEQALTRSIRAVARFEHLEENEDRWTVGPTLGLNDHLELKVNAVFSDEKPDRLLGQLTARW